MYTPLRPILRDCLVRYQRSALRDTGRRPMTFLRTPMDDELTLPGCNRPGYTFWQPVAWPEGGAPLGERAGAFHQSIIEYLSLCQFLEVSFQLPVAPKGSTLSFLYQRTFETCKNTVSAPPARAFEEAFLYQREHPTLPLAYCMAQTCDGGEPLMLMLRAEDGQAFILAEGRCVLDLKIGLDRLLPKLQFGW